MRKISEPDIIKFNDFPNGTREIKLQDGLARFYEITDLIIMKPDIDSVYLIIAINHQTDVLTLKYEAVKTPFGYERMNV